MSNVRNIQGMLGQVRHMQANLKKDQAQINKKVFTGKSPDNLVTVKMTGNHKMQDIHIASKVLKSKDQDMISDLVVSATNDAIKKITNYTQNTLNKYNPMA